MEKNREILIDTKEIFNENNLNSDFTIVSIGAGENQLEFIKKAKKMGYKVASLGKGRNSNEAIELSDYFSEIDTSDLDTIVKWLDSLKINIKAIGTLAGSCDSKTLLKLNNYYNLATSINEELIVGMEKEVQQKMYSKHGISNLKTYTTSEILKDIELIEDSQEYIVKPSIGGGSQDVFILSGNDLMDTILKKELVDNFVVQPVSYGKEYRVLIMIQNGEIKLLSPILRNNFKNTFFLGKLQYCSCEKDMNRIYKHAVNFINSMGIINSIIKYDIIVEKNNITLIEMDIGIGGGIYFQKYISEIFDTDIIELYLKLITGVDIEKFNAKNLDLITEYVFNEKNSPIKYNREQCERVLKEKFGFKEITHNSLKPVNKKEFSSNADFIFSVIHNNKFLNDWEINDYVNKNIFEER